MLEHVNRIKHCQRQSIDKLSNESAIIRLDKYICFIINRSIIDSYLNLLRHITTESNCFQFTNTIMLGNGTRTNSIIIIMMQALRDDIKCEDNVLASGDICSCLMVVHMWDSHNSHLMLQFVFMQ